MVTAVVSFNGLVIIAEDGVNQLPVTPATIGALAYIVVVDVGEQICIMLGVAMASST